MADSIVAEMQSIVRRASEPWEPGDSVKAQIDRAARRLRIGFRRARTFWYGVPCAVRAVEADQLRAAELDLMRRERQSLTARLDEIEARLNARERMAHGLGALDVPKDQQVLPQAFAQVGGPGGHVREVGIGSEGRR